MRLTDLLTETAQQDRPQKTAIEHADDLDREEAEYLGIPYEEPKALTPTEQLATANIQPMASVTNFLAAASRPLPATR
jgi:hypothetical protein